MTLNLGNNGSLNLGAGVSCFEVPQCIGLDACGYTNVSQLMQGLGNAIANPCSPTSCSLEAPVQNGMNSIIASIAQEFSTPCSAPSANIPCSAIGSNYSASLHTTIQSVFNEISSSLNGNLCNIINSNLSLNVQGTLQCQPPIQFPGLSGFVSNLLNQSVDTIISTIGLALNTSACQLLNGSYQPSIPFSGPLATCLNGNASISGILDSIRNLAADLVDSIGDTFNIIYNLNPCQLLNGATLNAGGVLGSCGYSFSFGIPSLKNIVQDLVDDVANTINNFIAAPCATYQINLPCGITSNAINGSSIIDSFFTSQCIKDKIANYIRTDACPIVQEVLINSYESQCVTAMVEQWVMTNDCALIEDVLTNGENPNCVANAVIDFVRREDASLIEAVLNTGNNPGAVAAAVIDFVRREDASLIEAVLNTGNNPGAVLTTVSDYVFNHACLMIEKINQGTATSAYHTNCTSHFNALVDSIIVDYLNSFTFFPDERSLAMLNFVNRAVELIGKRVKICEDDGTEKTIKVLTTVDPTGEGYETIYY